jgi:hypothetical protein
MSAGLRKRVVALVKQRLKEGKPVLKLEALIQRCWRASEQRNEFMHAVCAYRGDQDQVKMLVRGNKWKALPTAEEVRALSSEIVDLVVDLNHARLKGFIDEALKKKKGQQ